MSKKLVLTEEEQGGLDAMCEECGSSWTCLGICKYARDLILVEREINAREETQTSEETMSDYIKRISDLHSCPGGTLGTLCDDPKREESTND